MMPHFFACYMNEQITAIYTSMTFKYDFTWINHLLSLVVKHLMFLRMQSCKEDGMSAYVSVAYSPSYAKRGSTFSPNVHPIV